MEKDVTDVSVKVSLLKVFICYCLLCILLLLLLFAGGVCGRAMGDSIDEDEVRKAMHLFAGDGGCQHKIDGFTEKRSEEIRKIQHKYNVLSKPFYEKRSGFIEKVPKFWVNVVSVGWMWDWL